MYFTETTLVVISPPEEGYFNPINIQIFQILPQNSPEVAKPLQQLFHGGIWCADEIYYPKDI